MEKKNETTGQEKIVAETEKTQILSDEHTQADKPEKKENEKKRRILILIIKIVVVILLIAIGTFLILFIVARAAKYETIGAMLQSMLIELELMWQRVIY